MFEIGWGLSASMVLAYNHSHIFHISNYSGKGECWGWKSGVRQIEREREIAKSLRACLGTSLIPVVMQTCVILFLGFVGWVGVSI